MIHYFLCKVKIPNSGLASTGTYCNLGKLDKSKGYQLVENWTDFMGAVLLCDLNLVGWM